MVYIHINIAEEVFVVIVFFVMLFCKQILQINFNIYIYTVHTKTHKSNQSITTYINENIQKSK